MDHPLLYIVPVYHGPGAAYVGLIRGSEEGLNINLKGPEECLKRA